jgi:hypothetical protein
MLWDNQLKLSPVARMERSLIRDRLSPDYAALHPGYEPAHKQG